MDGYVLCLPLPPSQGTSEEGHRAAEPPTWSTAPPSTQWEGQCIRGGGAFEAITVIHLPSDHSCQPVPWGTVPNYSYSYVTLFCIFLFHPASWFKGTTFPSVHVPPPLVYFTLTTEIKAQEHEEVIKTPSGRTDFEHIWSGHVLIAPY